MSCELEVQTVGLKVNKPMMSIFLELSASVPLIIDDIKNATFKMLWFIDIGEWSRGARLDATRLTSRRLGETDNPSPPSDKLNFEILNA